MVAASPRASLAAARDRSAEVAARGQPTHMLGEVHEFIGFGAMDVTKPYEFIGFGAIFGARGPENLPGRPWVRPRVRPGGVSFWLTLVGPPRGSPNPINS